MAMLAAAALAATRTPQIGGTTIVSHGSGNDEKEGLNAVVIAPIVTREMLAAQGDRPPVHQSVTPRRPHGRSAPPATDLGLRLDKKHRIIDRGDEDTVNHAIPTLWQQAHVTASRTTAALHV
jgi:hypothetical protein